MVYIRNLKKFKKGIICDRTSVYGNPFYMKSEADRDDVCFYFDFYCKLIVLKNYTPKEAIERIVKAKPNAILATNFRIPDRDEFISSINKLENSDTLLCWCYPAKCHCDTLKVYVLTGFKKL